MNSYARVVLTCMLSAYSSMNYAQGSFNQNIMPLGDREALLANTGTGGVNSTGAVYYNPAALTSLHGNNFSFSGNAYFQFKFKASPLVTIGSDKLDFEGSGYRSFPSSMIGTRSMGDWVVAFSLLVPYSFNYEGKDNWILNQSSVPLSLQLIEDYKESYFTGGLSVARNLGNGWSIGFTLNGQYYSKSALSSSTAYIVSNPGITSILMRREVMESYTLYGVLGIQKKWEKFALGLRISTPSIYVYGSGDYYDYEYSNDGTTATVNELDIVDKKTNQKNPVDIRLGFSYQVTDRFFWVWDIAYALKVTHDYYEGMAPISEVNAENLRLSTGVNLKVIDGKDAYLGLSYNPYKELVNGEEKQQSLVSFSGGSRIQIGKTLNTIGVFYAISGLEGVVKEGTGESFQYASYFGVSIGTTVQLD